MAKFLDTSRGYLRLDFAHGRPNNNAMHHLHSGMIYEIRSMKSFAAFRIILVILGAPDCFVAVGEGIFQDILAHCSHANE